MDKLCGSVGKTDVVSSRPTPEKGTGAEDHGRWICPGEGVRDMKEIYGQGEVRGCAVWSGKYP